MRKFIKNIINKLKIKINSFRYKDSEIHISGKVRFILEDDFGNKEITPWVNNIVPTCGRTAVGRRLINSGLLANEGIITYGAVGTGTNIPANADTTLQTELKRKAVASGSYAANVITIRTYFSKTEGNGDLKEFGLFGEAASAAVDSGTLFQRVAISKTKTNAKTLTCESVITIS